MISDRDERWTFGNSLNVENPDMGDFERNTLYSTITLTKNGDPYTPTQSNWVLASIPTPNATKGWKISSVMLRYTIIGKPGIIDKVVLRDGDLELYSFENLTVGPISGWQTLTLPLPEPKAFQFGLGVGIHVVFLDYFFDCGSADFRFASVGLEFIKESSIVPPKEFLTP